MYCLCYHINRIREKTFANTIIIFQEVIMVKDYVAEFREDLKKFHEMTQKFYKKEITVPQYKGFSGGFGSYAQRGGEASMLRLRLTGGEVNKEQLSFIADSIEKYNINLAHLTTCESIQLHNLNELQVCSLIEEAFDHGIITRGGGGDFPRNVMCSPLSGVQTDEYIDVLPYAKAAGDYLLGFIKTVKLPRKLKVCFSNGIDNSIHATFRDLGFVAEKDGTFTVYSAGGLGRNPRMGAKVAEHVEPSKILYYTKAMVETFIAYGNYENRAAARTRFMQETLGTEGYIKAYQEKLAQVLATEKLDIEVTPCVVTKTGEGNVSHPRAIAQKQPGLYAVAYHPLGGNPAPEFFRNLSNTIKDMENVKVRIAPDESLYIINLTASEAKKILALTDDGANTLFETSVACIGASICQVGARDSQGLLDACIKRVRVENFKDGVLPKIHISGCPSSCSAHQIGALGFRGGVKQTPDGPKPAFAVYEKGSDTLGTEAFGTDLGIMLEEEIPEFFVELGNAITAVGTTYDSFVKNNRDAFMEIVEKYI